MLVCSNYYTCHATVQNTATYPVPYITKDGGELQQEPTDVPTCNSDPLPHNLPSQLPEVNFH